MMFRAIAAAIMAVMASPAVAGDIEVMAGNLEISCSNHFRQRPNRPSNDSKKFCSCFASEFTATFSLRELDAANGVVTAEIQDQFDRAADICSRDIAPAVAQSGRAWISDAD